MNEEEEDNMPPPIDTAAGKSIRRLAIMADGVLLTMVLITRDVHRPASLRR
jgi:hypothetical protein